VTENAPSIGKEFRKLNVPLALTVNSSPSLFCSVTDPPGFNPETDPPITIERQFWSNASQFDALSVGSELLIGLALTEELIAK
jgi:hypothetical protein